MDFITYLIIFFGSVNVIRMGIFLIGSDLYDLQSTLRKKRNNKKFVLPTISVIIPAHNEAGTVLRAVESIYANNYPQDKLQVIVVDDGSKDQSKKILTRYKKTTTNKNLTIVFKKNEGKARALNYALKHYAKGTLVMCLDGDSYINNDALKKAVQYFTDKRVMALASNVRIIPSGTLLNIIQRFEYIVCYQMKRAQSQFNIEYIIGGIGSTFRTSFIKKIGYFDQDTVTEDIDLTMKILQYGNKDHRVIYGADVVSNTESVLSVSDLMKQRFRWKWGRSQTFYKNKNLFFNTDKKFTKALTFLYLPYALFSDIAFFFEPLLIGYLLYIVYAYGDILTLLSAMAVISLYLSFNIIMENALTIKEKIILLPLVPSMYIFFYILSFVEYYALIKTLIKLPTLKSSIEKQVSKWTHVRRETNNIYSPTHS